MYRPQNGNYQRKLTTSSGASSFAISGRHLHLFRRLVNSAEAEGHHPNISFGWGNVTVYGLHENDFITATKIDRIFARTAATA